MSLFLRCWNADLLCHNDASLFLRLGSFLSVILCRTPSANEEFYGSKGSAELQTVFAQSNVRKKCHFPCAAGLRNLLCHNDASPFLRLWPFLSVTMCCTPFANNECFGSNVSTKLQIVSAPKIITCDVSVRFVTCLAMSDFVTRCVIMMPRLSCNVGCFYL